MWPSRNANSAEGHSLSAALIMSDPTVAMSNSPATQRCALSLVVVIVGESSGRQDSNLRPLVPQTSPLTVQETGERGLESQGPAGRPTIVGQPDRPFFGGRKATATSASRRWPRTTPRRSFEPRLPRPRAIAAFRDQSGRPCDLCGVPCAQRGCPWKLGVSTRPEAILDPLPNTDQDRYLAKVRVASSSLVSRSTP